jgi:hypothetical protein
MLRESVGVREEGRERERRREGEKEREKQRERKREYDVCHPFHLTVTITTTMKMEDKSLEMADLFTPSGTSPCSCLII